MSNLSPWLLLIASCGSRAHGHGCGGARPLSAKPTTSSWSRRFRSRWGMASIAVVVYVVMALMAIDADAFRMLSGMLLIAWGLYHFLYGHCHRLHIGLRTGLFGLFAWSFAMATAHGAGTNRHFPADAAVRQPASTPLFHMRRPARCGSPLWRCRRQLAMPLTTGSRCLDRLSVGRAHFLRRRRSTPRHCLDRGAIDGSMANAVVS